MEINSKEDLLTIITTLQNEVEELKKAGIKENVDDIEDEVKEGTADDTKKERTEDELDEIEKLLSE